VISATSGGGDGRRARAPIRVTDAHMTAALDQLLDTRNALTQALLGGARTSQ